MIKSPTRALADCWKLLTWSANYIDPMWCGLWGAISASPCDLTGGKALWQVKSKAHNKSPTDPLRSDPVLSPRQQFICWWVFHTRNVIQTFHHTKEEKDLCYCRRGKGSINVVRLNVQPERVLGGDWQNVQKWRIWYCAPGRQGARIQPWRCLTGESFFSSVLGLHCLESRRLSYKKAFLISQSFVWPSNISTSPLYVFCHFQTSRPSFPNRVWTLHSVSPGNFFRPLFLILKALFFTCFFHSLHCELL